MAIIPQSKANVLATSGAVKKRLAEIQSTLPKDMSVEINIDNGVFIAASLKNVVSALTETLVLVLIVIFLFLGTARATTLSLGAVVTPLGEGGPRFSLDYSRVRRSHDFYRLNDNLVLAHEEMWPERVTREPLTDADRALGYTAGIVTRLDARAINAGTLQVESIDGRIDWPVPFLGGTIRLPAGPVKMALATGAPILPIFSVRTGEGKVRLFVEPAIRVEPANECANVTETGGPHPALLEWAAVLERYVRAYPDQWLVIQPALCEDVEASR